jgi:hypothetical protein
VGVAISNDLTGVVAGHSRNPQAGNKTGDRKNRFYCGAPARPTLSAYPNHPVLETRLRECTGLINAG